MLKCILLLDVIIFPLLVYTLPQCHIMLFLPYVTFIFVYITDNQNLISFQRIFITKYYLEGEW